MFVAFVTNIRYAAKSCHFINSTHYRLQLFFNQWCVAIINQFVFTTKCSPVVMNQPDQTQQTKRRYFVAYFASRQWHSKRRRPFHKRMTKDCPMQDVFHRHSLRLEISISNLFFVVVLINFPQSNLINETSDAMYIKHSQGHNNPKALSILTQSTHLDQSRSF